MQDMDNERASYVRELERKIEHLQKEHDRYKKLADKWTPVITVESGAENGKTKFGLRFGNKNAQAAVSEQFLSEMDSTSATTQILDVLVESIVKDQLRSVLEADVQRAQQAAKSAKGAGKW